MPTHLDQIRDHLLPCLLRCIVNQLVQIHNSLLPLPRPPHFNIFQYLSITIYHLILPNHILPLLGPFEMISSMQSNSLYFITVKHFLPFDSTTLQISTNSFKSSFFIPYWIYKSFQRDVWAFRQNSFRHTSMSRGCSSVFLLVDYCSQTKGLKCIQRPSSLGPLMLFFTVFSISQLSINLAPIWFHLYNSETLVLGPSNSVNPSWLIDWRYFRKTEEYSQPFHPLMGCLSVYSGMILFLCGAYLFKAFKNDILPFLSD